MLPLKIFCFILLRETRCDKNERIIVKGFIQCKRICQTVCDRYSGDGCVGSLHENISFVSIYMVVLGGMMSITTMSMDESSGFNKFYLTTPGGVKRMVAAKYLFFLLTIIAGMIVALLIRGIAMVFPMINTSGFDVGTLFVTGFILAAAFSISFPVIYKYGAEKGRYFYIAAFLVIFAVIYLVNYVAHIPAPEKILTSIPDAAYVVGIVGIGAVIIFISYFVSIRIVTRKEW